MTSDSSKNKHGLARYIPADVKYQIRKKAGFGCVVCGNAIIQYEHIKPEFCDAKIHDPTKMTILCGSCHDKVTRGIWSKQKIARAANEPKCLQQGHAKSCFDLGDELPIVELGGSEWSNTPSIVTAFGETILGFTKEPESGLVEVSGIFHDDEDREIFRIEYNEWIGDSGSFDIEVTGQSLTIRKQARKIALRIDVVPPGKFLVKNIDLLYRGARIFGNHKDGIFIQSPDGSTIAVGKSKGDSCEMGIIIEENGVAFGRRCKTLTL